MHEWGDLQIVSVNKNKESCRHCGVDLLDITNFIYNQKTLPKPTYWEELCKCRSCNCQFILHYDIFDSEGHIYSRIFSEDINNVNYNWQEALIDSQKSKIAQHLEHCKTCCDRLSQEILTEAWLKDFMQNLRKKMKK